MTPFLWFLCFPLRHPTLFFAVWGWRTGHGATRFENEEKGETEGTTSYRRRNFAENPDPFFPSQLVRFAGSKELEYFICKVISSGCFPKQTLFNFVYSYKLRNMKKGRKHIEASPLDKLCLIRQEEENGSS